MIGRWNTYFGGSPRSSTHNVERLYEWSHFQLNSQLYTNVVIMVMSSVLKDLSDTLQS